MDDGKAWMLVCVIVFGCICVVTLVAVWAMQRRQAETMRALSRQQQRDTNEELMALQETIRSHLSQFEFQMNQSMKTDLNQLREHTAQRLSTMEHTVHSGLHQGFQTTGDAIAKMMERMARIDKTQQSLDALSGSIASLQHVLVDKKSRGTFGEVELYSILEQVFGINDKRWLKQAHLSNGTIADALLLSDSPMGNIPIDSKFPLENYNRMYDEGLTAVQQQALAKQFRADVIKHMRAIKEKYVGLPETADFAYMFIPAEAVFSYIYGTMDDVIQLSYQMKVYLVSATTLMAYVTAIRAIYLGQKRDERVALMQKEYTALAQEFTRFADRFETLQKDFEKVYKDFDQIAITNRKIQRRFDEIAAVEWEGGQSADNP